jgi:dsRNA-specific ribonuclease
MISEEYLVWLQSYFGHQFRNRSLLEKALTAPGAEGNKTGTKEERDKYEGNRKLAQMGGSLISLVVRKKAFYEEGVSRSKFHTRYCRLSAYT